MAWLSIPDAQMAGKAGFSHVRRVSRELREHGFMSESLPWALRPHALFVAFAPYDDPRFALSVVAQHGSAGATAATPSECDTMTGVRT